MAEGRPASLSRVLEQSRVVVCVGPGGVGKTSTSAAFGLAAAYAGKRVVVLTIDPARRLANALGLPEIGNEERDIPVEAYAPLGRPPPAGRLSAMMLDIKRMWDAVVWRHHPDPERRARLLSNRFYTTLSTKLAGSQEYMAMEMLYELSVREEDPLDLIVLDTPPAANAVDFLEAPSRMIDALANDATRWLVEPFAQKGRVTQRLFDAGSSFFIRSIGRFTGTETLQELAELLHCFQGMYEGFRERAKAVKAILGDARTQFLIVSAPRPGPVADARSFHRKLVDDGLSVGGFVLNRATVDPFHTAIREGRPAVPAAELERRVESVGGSRELAHRLSKVALDAARAAEEERGAVAKLVPEAGTTPVVVVPQLPRDIHDLVGLDALRSYLFP